MPDDLSTEDQSQASGAEELLEDGPHPGLVVIFTSGRPCVTVLEVGRGGRELDRDTAGLVLDRRISRRHAQVHYEGNCFHVLDLGSQNGTYLDGRSCSGRVAARAPRVLRLGDSLMLAYADVRKVRAHGVQVLEGRVIGPDTAVALAAIAGHARTGTVLHIRGESGTGKEHAAQEFHARGPQPAGPFVAVNCAAIPEELAERLLFGAVRGAYSGAAQDAQGYLQAAHGGTLFLDEVAELDLGVQAKLLRVLESREVLPLGAVRARPVEFRLCTATHRDLRALVGAGRLRADLYFRIGMPTISLLPLRDRPADIPFLVALIAERAAPDLTIHPSLIEACLLRPWTGNVRELLAAVHMAVQAAQANGDKRIDASHLSPEAGTALPESTSATPVAPAAPEDVRPPHENETESIRAAAIREALRQSQGNITAAATALGVHRTQLRRWLKRYGIEPR